LDFLRTHADITDLIGCFDETEGVEIDKLLPEDTICNQHGPVYDIAQFNLEYFL
jgi:hypothetical protein